MSTKLASGIAKKTSAYNADPRRITRRADWNTRFDMGEIEALADSIKHELARDPKDGGLLMPLRLKRIEGTADFDFELVDGDRRLTAIELLISQGVEFPEGVAMKLVDKAQDDRTSMIQMITANTGKPFLPLEEAAAYKKLRDFGMTVAEICKAVGRTDVHVRETMELLSADAAVQDAVKEGKVSASTAKVIAAVAKGNKELQKELVEEAAAAAPRNKIGQAARARLEKKIQDQRDANNVAKGKEVKLRMITSAQLAALGESVAKHLKVLSKEAGYEELLNDQAAYRATLQQDDKLAAAYAFGALQALLAVTGHDVSLDI